MTVSVKREHLKTTLVHAFLGLDWNTLTRQLDAFSRFRACHGMVLQSCVVLSYLLNRPWAVTHSLLRGVLRSKGLGPRHLNLPRRHRNPRALASEGPASPDGLAPASHLLFTGNRRTGWPVRRRGPEHLGYSFVKPFRALRRELCEPITPCLWALPTSHGAFPALARALPALRGLPCCTRGPCQPQPGAFPV